MTKLIPQGKTIAAFLLAKGWEMAEVLYNEQKNPFTIYFRPPSHLNIEDTEFVMKVPIFQDTIDYRQYVDMVVSDISTIYQIDKFILEKIFAKPLDSIFDISLKIEQNELVAA